jgi:hypothetical protein
MTPAQLPLAPLIPVSGLVHRVLDAAAHGVTEGSRRNARAALEARHALTRESAEVLAGLPAQRRRRTAARRQPA